MSLGIEQWLGSLGLEKYIPSFVEAEIDLLALPYLTDDDLQTLGLPLGPRRKVLGAASLLSVDDTKLVSTSEASISTSYSALQTPQQDLSGPSSAAERRHLTVMFIDLVGSTEMSTRYDAETLRDIITSYQNNVAGIIARHEGFVARFMGDGVLCYFGWPRANEDDAERAVRAGLATIASVKNMKSPDGTPLSTRVGVASGIVVVGDLIGSGASEEAAVVGETPNLAARLQSLAQPDQLVLPRETCNLLGNVFSLKSLGTHELKGIAHPVHTFSVSGKSTLESRFDARRNGALTPIYGREQELQQIQAHWSRVQAGKAQLILVTGEAGIGKSRLIRALINSISADDHNRITSQCSAYHSDSAFYPIISQITYDAGFQPDDSNETRLDKLAHLIGQDTEKVTLLAMMMGIATDGRYPPLNLTPTAQRTRTMQAICEVVVRRSKDKPLLFVFEDLHWIDPTSLELLDTALEAIQNEKVLILATARPTFSHNFGGHPSVRRLLLNRLERADVIAIVDQLSGGKPLPDDVVQIITNRTDGIPLFVEELTKTILENGALTKNARQYSPKSTLNTSTIPVTLHDSLMARLDRLEPLKIMAQTAACIGREFSHRLIESVSPLQQSDLCAALEGLIEAELIYRRGLPPEAHYTFKHALVRDAAYESLLKDARQEIHRNILQYLIEDTDNPPELLAWHAEAANQSEQAIDLWEQASEAALARPAFDEAISHLERATALLSPEIDSSIKASLDPNTISRSLELQIKLGRARCFGNGYGDSKTITAFRHALELADKIDKTPLRFSALYGIWIGHHIHSEHASALAVAEEMQVHLQENTDKALTPVANRLVGTSLYSLGRFVAAQPFLATAHSTYKTVKHISTQHNDLDHGVCNSCTIAANLWALGETRQADEHLIEAESEALSTGQTNTICYMHNYLAGVTRSARNYAVSARHSNSLSTVAIENGLPFYAAKAQSQLAVLAAAAGDADAIDKFLELDAYCVTIGTLTVPSIRIDAGYYALNLELYDKAQQLADMARSLINQTGEVIALSNLHRLDGALAVKRGQPEIAISHLQTALAVARKQHSKSWELRSAIDLAAVLHSINRTREACFLLQPICASIAEGDCADDIAAALEFIENSSL